MESAIEIAGIGSATETIVTVESCEFWIGEGKRSEVPAGGKLASLNSPVSLPIDAHVLINGLPFNVNSAGLIINGERGILVYGLR